MTKNRTTAHDRAIAHLGPGMRAIMHALVVSENDGRSVAYDRFAEEAKRDPRVIDDVLRFWWESQAEFVEEVIGGHYDQQYAADDYAYLDPDQPKPTQLKRT